MTSRYDVGGLAEAQFEPGSRGRVLRNLLGIRRRREMDAFEAIKLIEATDWAIHNYSADHRFTAADICRLPSPIASSFSFIPFGMAMVAWHECWLR